MTETFLIDGLTAHIATLRAVRPVGRISRADGAALHVIGLAPNASIGDGMQVYRKRAAPLRGEVVQIIGDTVVMLAEEPTDGVSLNDRATLISRSIIAPSTHWLGRIIDPMGRPLDGKPLLRGAVACPLLCPPPNAADRRPFGTRISTGLAVTNTMLPMVKGQRMGLFAGSGVGKSTLLGKFARHMTADVVVIAMIGERGRELRHFVDEVLGKKGLARSVVVAATSDQSPLLRRRCAWTAMAVAEYYRNQGLSVLFLADSITRFAEAHREVAVAAGEAPVLRGYPPSTTHLITSLCERAGPGAGPQGDITALFSVLVAGSDMDEPIADILRGVLDGHIVLDRSIAERGRFPAVDVLRSVSRSLPAAANARENNLLSQTRKMLSVYDSNAMMIRAGLYTQGTDPEVDKAIQLHPEIELFLSKEEPEDAQRSFSQLELILRRAGAKLT
ncbi:FliI/YscN family ATPase [Sulfitobacter guttiformis]|uniref:Flagellum-specific ATP synthase n=1 Tax=Sulfitobacter guttiformis TaxID=74349 RepID=A0A420DS43_9RHOB|nr:FliI/YscN family ATPase [Sulfitobacter guttiformis]KIN74548.1 Flagellum-specific ATP synthase [Sulfitobacter guttiformis KCTC 32187]RKE97134.1 flagellum-specific ATP synthase [Sulfitobacter guttiformis]